LALDRCLSDLGIDYVDEFLIHFPISMEVWMQRSDSTHRYSE
jgi:diketogulonate reductase-like aldo/keto reductase